MRIAYIGLRGVPARYSGIERAVEEIGSRLVGMGHDVTVYCMDSAYAKHISEYKGMYLRYVRTIPSNNLEMLSYSVISTLISSFKSYDIVHFHALGPAVMSFMPRFIGRRTVVTVHGLDWKREKWGPVASAYLRFGERASFLFPHSTIVVSRSLQKYFKSTYCKDTIYIPNGVPLGTRRPLLELKKMGIEEGGYLLFVGRLTPEKNVHQLIQAYRGLSTKLKLLIVGSPSHLGSYLSTLQALADNDARIVFTGPQYGEVLAELFSNAGLFILPSALEGLPIALLEAMSFGTPTLVSDIPENLEVTENEAEICGFAFKVGNIENLRNTLESLLEQDGLLKLIGSKGQLLVENKYNWDNIAQETERNYMEIAQ